MRIIILYGHIYTKQSPDAIFTILYLCIIILLHGGDAEYYNCILHITTSNHHMCIVILYDDIYDKKYSLYYICVQWRHAFNDHVNSMKILHLHLMKICIGMEKVLHAFFLVWYYMSSMVWHMCSCTYIWILALTYALEWKRYYI